jgi:Flp pilus assembly protein TadD
VKRVAWHSRGTCCIMVIVIACGLVAHAQDLGAADACLSSANESAQGGDLHTAELKTLKCLRLNPDGAPVLAYLGVILTKQGRLSEADEYLEQALRVDASRTNTRFNLALNEFRLGKSESAAGNLESVLRVQPSYAPASLLLGTILAQKGECRRAVTLLESVGELAVRQPDSAAALSGCYYVAGNRDKARQILVAAVDRSQTAEWALIAVGVALRSSDLGAAEAMLSQARIRYPNDPQVAYTEALVQFNAGRFAESRAMLEQLAVAGSRQADLF